MSGGYLRSLGYRGCRQEQDHLDPPLEAWTCTHPDGQQEQLSPVCEGRSSSGPGTRKMLLTVYFLARWRKTTEEQQLGSVWALCSLGSDLQDAAPTWWRSSWQSRVSTAGKIICPQRVLTKRIAQGLCLQRQRTSHWVARALSVASMTSLGL